MTLETDRIFGICMTFVLVIAVCAPMSAWAGDVNGHYRERTVKGVPSSPWHEFYEWNAFCCPSGASTNRTCRTGACEGTLTWDGAYIYPGMPDGLATIYCDQPNFFAAPKVREITISGSLNVDTFPNTDYFMAFGQNSSSWGSNPWEWYSGTWYQTFVATGTGINRVSFKLAAPADTVTVAIYESNGGAVSSWPQVGIARTADAGCTGCDVWVAWPHGNVPTTPGQTYAVSFQNSGGNMGFYVHRDSVGTGYSSGTAYHDDTAQSYDLYATVFSDNDGTILTYQMDSSDPGPSTDWAGAWAQSFTAQGSSLAAVGLFAQGGGDAEWDADVLIFNDLGGGVQGSQVGPTKNLPDAGWYGPGTGFGGMSYNPGEVSLTPGQQYLVVFSPWDSDGGGFNPLRRPGGDVLPGGTAYIGSGGTWSARPYDLSMTIMEYAGTGPAATPTNTPTTLPTPVPGTNLLSNWGFESSSGSSHPDWVNNSDFGTNGLYPNPGGAHEGSQWASYSYGGAIIQELYQTVSVVPGHSYRLAAYCNIGGEGSTATAKLMWHNGGYPEKGNGTLVDSETWTYGQPFVSWAELSGFVMPTGGTLTFILQTDIGGYAAGVNWDSCSVVDQSVSDTPTPTNTPTNTRTNTPTNTRTNTPTNTPTNTRTNTPTSTSTEVVWTPQTGVGSDRWEVYR